MKLLCVPLLLAGGLAAQAPSFEVASIKPYRGDGSSSSIRRTAGQIAMQNVSLRKWILYAYGIPDDRYYAISGPSWLPSESFDVAAKWSGEPTREQQQQMLQNLLAERFKLQLHKETRQVAGYALVVAKGGVKIRAEEAGQSTTNGRPGRLEATKITMQKFTDLLARATGQPVANETGLNGAFSFTLEWTPDETQKLRAEGESAPAPGGTTLFAALQEQLGLKLEGRKAAVDMLVVDHIERAPTEN